MSGARQRPAAGPLRRIETLDSLSAEPFVAALAPLFENAPGFLWRLAAAHGAPFGSWERLFARARELAHAMPEPLQVDLVDAHPRLGARPETLSTMSAREQGPAVPASAVGAPADETLRRFNLDYESRFGFRYCVFVAGRPLAALVPELEAALAADRDAELHRALDAVVDIAAARRAAEATGRAAEAAGPA